MSSAHSSLGTPGLPVMRDGGGVAGETAPTCGSCPDPPLGTTAYISHYLIISMPPPPSSAAAFHSAFRYISPPSPILLSAFLEDSSSPILNPATCPGPHSHSPPAALLS